MRVFNCLGEGGGEGGVALLVDHDEWGKFLAFFLCYYSHKVRVFPEDEVLAYFVPFAQCGGSESD